MKTKILKVLRESKYYISGQTLCDELGVSRTAIWKIMNQLKEEGYEIDSVSNKGYRILSYPNLVTKSELLSRIETQWLGQEIYFYDKVDSTNDTAKQMAEQKCPHGTIVITEQQAAGKGRRGKNWISPSGENLYFSMILRPDMEAIHASMLTLVTALSVAEAVEEMTWVQAKIKWPNDVLIHDKKICGILTEMSTEMEFINYVIIGIGININTREMDSEIETMATSMQIETGKEWSRAELFTCFCTSFEKNYNIFLQTEDLSELMEVYNKKLVNAGREVKLLTNGLEIKRVAIGIDETGALLTEDENKNMESVISGEVSVRGLYGYV